MARRSEDEGRLRDALGLRQTRRDFAADIRITPTFKQGQHIGYCGVTIPRPDVPVDAAMPRISFGTRLLRWLVVTRAPFLAVTLVPVTLGAVWTRFIGGVDISWAMFALVLLGASLLHVAANTFNDYFDWTSGTDPDNNDYLCRTRVEVVPSSSG